VRVQLPFCERETRAGPGGGLRPCPRSGGNTLKALVAGLCISAFALVATLVAAAPLAITAPPAAAAPNPKPAAEPNRATLLHNRLAYKRTTARRAEGAIAFFRNHPRILHSVETGPRARRALALATERLDDAEADIEELERALRRIELVRLGQMTPAEVICEVFGRRYCRQAVAVAWCESRHTTTARNGQYLGLFQMGSSERVRFGHGPAAWDQARAAYRYFVVAGRDWSPWSCKPW
jgi:hypothetical protein